MPIPAGNEWNHPCLYEPNGRTRELNSAIKMVSLLMEDSSAMELLEEGAATLGDELRAAVGDEGMFIDGYYID